MPGPRAHFAEQLRELEQEMVQLGQVAIAMLELAMQALVKQDRRTAHSVLAEDDVADSLDLRIENQCMHLLAQQQPMARDLRTIGSILKAIADLERIADFSCDIAREVIHLANEPYFKPLKILPEMGARVLRMVRDTLQAFVSRDLELVIQICTVRDDEVDEMYRQVSEQLLADMQSRPEVVVQAVRLLFVAHYLERIADHCTNVGERIHYIETGHLKEFNIAP